MSETVEWLADHFSKLRESFRSTVVQPSSSGLIAASDLYSHLHPYVNYLADFLGYMGQLLIIHLGNRLGDNLLSGGCLT